MMKKLFLAGENINRKDLLVIENLVNLYTYRIREKHLDSFSDSKKN